MNLSEVANECGLSESDLRRWLDRLHDSKKIWLMRRFGHANFPGSDNQLLFYGLECDRLGAAKVLDALSSLRHEMAFALRHQAGGSTFFWRDNRGRKVDFVLQRRGSHVDLVDIIRDTHDEFPRGFLALRRRFPRGNNYQVSTRP